jgi:hypothetical protein
MIVSVLETSSLTDVSLIMLLSLEAPGFSLKLFVLYFSILAPGPILFPSLSNTIVCVPMSLESFGKN